MDDRRMFQLRVSGMTFQEIAEISGISRQAVHEKVKRYALKLTGIRGQGFDISTIIYDGIYEHFKENLYETLSGFSKAVYGYTEQCGKGKDATMRNFLQGKHASRFNIEQIKKMCEICGRSFEETFRERKTNSSVSLIDGHVESDKAFWEDTH